MTLAISRCFGCGQVTLSMMFFGYKTHTFLIRHVTKTISWPPAQPHASPDHPEYHDEILHYISVVISYGNALLCIPWVPHQVDITTEDFGVLFFNHWYCLFLTVFMSHFWNTLHTLCGLKLKMSTAYHPQMDGSSEWTNKMINQAPCFHVDR